MTLIQTFHGNATNGTELTAVYAEQPAANVAFALVFPGNDLPRLVHWGRPLAAPATVIDMFDAQMPQRVSGALDYTPWPSVLPTQSESWIGATRFDVRRDGVELFCKFAVSNITAETVAAGKTYVMGEKDGYPSWSVADEPKQTPTVTVTAEDVEQHVKLIWACELDETGLIRQNAEVVNTGEGQLEVGKIELAFTVPADANEILTTTGHHLRERSPQRQDFTLGRFAKASMAGRPDFDATLLLSVGEKGFGFTHGNVYSAHVAWSGNSVLSAERLPYTSGVIGGGEVLFGGEISLANGESYTTPWLIGSYGEGLNEVAARFHGYIRRVHRDWLAEHNIAPKPRPVILNTWEAVYFNHDYDTLTALADKAVESGVERFVVDDGWFGSRRDDTSGLGDWQISQDVWPDGDKSLKALADYVHGKGLEFGLWFEPEMVNLDSDLFRTHPDWVLKPTEGRLPMQGRTQQVVDLTNPDAYDYIYDAMDKLVGELGIDYIKWDHNKLVTEAVSPRTGRPAVHQQTLAVYRMAFFGHMGIEWNLLKEPQEDIDKLAEWVAEFKKHREWFAVDTVVHSDAADPAVRLDGVVMPNKAAAIYRFTQLTTSQTYPASPVRLPGLDPDKVYEVSPLDVSLDLAKQDITNGQSPLGWWKVEGVKMTGRALATYGIRPPALHPAQAVLFKAVLAPVEDAE